MALALPFSPGITILLLTAGILLAAVEFNRPGLIVAGSGGMLATLVAIASILHQPHPGTSLGSLACASAFLAADFRRPNVAFAIGGGLALLLAYQILARQSDSTSSLVIAFVCALTVTVTTAILARIARRARVNKGLD